MTKKYTIEYKGVTLIIEGDRVIQPQTWEQPGLDELNIESVKTISGDDITNLLEYDLWALELKIMNDERIYG